MSPVPTTRLLWSVLGVALLAAVGGPLPEVAAIGWFTLGGLLLAAVFDLAWSLARGTPLTVGVAPVTRLTKDRPGALALEFTNLSEQARQVRVGLGLPDGVTTPHDEQPVDIPGGRRLSRVEWPCTPHRRGRFTGLVVGVEWRSPLGWWTLRTRTTLTGELRVYPNLFAERRQLAALFLPSSQQGALARRTVGRGRDFEKLREYLPGDGYDEIHWKATAKRGHPITKIFQIERTQEIYVVIDCSRLSARTVVHDGIAQSALDRTITAALVLLLTAQTQGDKFGLIAHDDRVRVLLPAGRGPGHYGACREAVLGLRSTESTPDMAEIVRHLRGQLRRRSLLFFLTDLTDPVLAEDFAKHISILSRQHLVLASQLRGEGVAPLFSGADATSDAELYQRLAGHARWSEARTLAQTLKPLGVTATLMENETLAGQLVTQYLQVKRRQLL